jgi:glycosyltransferase involved in cell wall biosynthesis
MAKVLWLADAGCHTGFGRVTHSIGERLVEDFGHEIHVLAINHRGDDFPSMRDPKKKTPLWLYRTDTFKGNDLYGYTRVLELLGKVMPDVVVMYNDVNIILKQLLENDYDPDHYLAQMRPIISYCPVDGTNLPLSWQSIQQRTNMVVMSKYGQRMYPHSKLVYHGVDTEQFWPVSERPIVTSSGITCTTKRDCKEALGFDPDGFLILRVDKNSGRKDFAATMKALVPVMKRHEDIQVHFHTEQKGGQSGVNLLEMTEREPEISPKRWFYPGLHDSWIGWPQVDLNALYNAADLFVSTSRGEGFGMTLAEALSAGVPVIAQNVSAIPEVVGPGGILLEPQRLITVPSGEDIWLSDIDAFTDAIEALYSDPERRRDLGEAGRRHVVSTFDWDKAAASFDKFIVALEETVKVALRKAWDDEEGEALVAASDAKEAP